MHLSMLPLESFFVAFLLALSIAGTQSADTSREENDLLYWTNFSVKCKGRSILCLEKPGKITSGRILGVLGPSGSGKTTFLNALSKSLKGTKNFKILGEIHSSDGKALNKEDVAYIHQEDSFFSQLSVRETLKLAASLRLYSNVSDETISSVIKYLALDKVADNYVGDIVNRGISGGERKRLAVACEMLGTAPALLIADEPSSGLDSFQATQVVQMLKKIAVEKNIAVVCSIHQPRSSIWNVFDDILLLGPGGHVIFHGPRTEVLPYFASIGHVCPGDTNPAEFLIDLVSTGESNSIVTKGISSESEKKSRELALKFISSPSKFLSVAEISKSGQHVDSTALIITNRARPPVWQSPGRFAYRFGLLLQRALRQTLRDNATNLVRIGTSALLATIIGTIFGKSGGAGPLTSKGVSDKVTLIAHAAINVSMLSMIKALQLFKRERAVVDRERAQGRYSAFEYLLAKLTAELPLDAAIGAVFGYVVHNRGQLQSNSHVFAGLLALVSCVTSSLGLGVGACLPIGDVALSVGPALMVVYVILGAVGPAGAGNDLPLLLKPFQKASPIRWACEALCAAELRGRTLTNRKSKPDSQSQSQSQLVSSRRAGISLLSLHGIANILRGTVRFIGSQLLAVGDALSKMGTIDPRKTSDVLKMKNQGGDRTLAILNIPDATVSKSSSVLGKMLAVHILVAWAGLLLNGSKSS